MSISLHWFLPTAGDSRDVVGFGPVEPRRPHNESVGQQRMTALHDGRRSDLVVAPNLWAGFGLVRGGAGTAPVGSHDEVAERIAEYAAAGFDHVILSGQPHLEEAWWFGVGVIPRLCTAGLLTTPPSPTSRTPSQDPGDTECSPLQPSLS